MSAELAESLAVVCYSVAGLILIIMAVIYIVGKIRGKDYFGDGKDL